MWTTYVSSDKDYKYDYVDGVCSYVTIDKYKGWSASYLLYMLMSAW